MRILIAEDDPRLSDQCAGALRAEGRVVDVAADGEDAAHLGATEPYDLIVLDLGLPNRDGLSILKEWRAQSIAVPVLILTARDGWSERVDGLDAGADDYMVKPFHMPELLAQVRALIRRRTGQINPLFQSGALSFDTRNARALRDGIPIELTQQETLVLTYLVHNAGRFVSRTELSDHIYSYDQDRDSNTIAVFIARLRKKLGVEIIESARGKGYVIRPA
jgi:two-component system, OmpR family, response regulator